MTPLTSALTAALLHSLWQDAVIAVVLLAALVALRHRAARARYAVGCAALAAMALLPPLTAARVYARQTAPPVSPPPVGILTSPATPLALAPREGVIAPGAAAPSGRELLAAAQLWALPIWCAGVLACSLRLLGSGAHAVALKRRVMPADKSTQLLALRLAARLGMTRHIAVGVSSMTGPATLGWLKPVILLPPATALGLTPEQLEMVLAHELAHVRRHDYLVNILQLIVETLFFYHPAVWWASRRIRLEREVCCDDEAVRVCGDAVGYARALAVLARAGAVTPAPAVGAAGGALLHRVQRLLGVRAAHDAASPWSMLVAAALAVACLVLTPAWMHAQDAAPQTVTLSGTLYDPLGQPAEHTSLVLIGRDSNEFPEVRTDAGGRYQFAGLRPGRYFVRTAVTDFITPTTIDLGAGENRTLDIRLGMDETAVNVHVCARCSPDAYRLPAVIRSNIEGFQADAAAAVVSAADPEEGWEAFNEKVFPYPASLPPARLEGTVTLEGRIATDGSTANLVVTSAPDARLAEAAAALVQQQRWHPARVRSTPVEVPLHITVEFVLRAD